MRGQSDGFGREDVAGLQIRVLGPGQVALHPAESVVWQFGVGELRMMGGFARHDEQACVERVVQSGLPRVCSAPVAILQCMHPVVGSGHGSEIGRRIHQHTDVEALLDHLLDVAGCFIGPTQANADRIGREGGPFIAEPA